MDADANGYHKDHGITIGDSIMSRKGSIFPRGFKEGDPLARKGVNKGLNLMAKYWETLDINDGYIDWSNDRPMIVVGGAPESVLSTFLARIISSIGSEYEWIEQRAAVNGVEDDANGKSSSDRGVAIEINNADDVEDDAIVIMFELLDENGELQYRFLDNQLPPDPDNPAEKTFALTKTFDDSEPPVGTLEWTEVLIKPEPEE